MKNNIDKNLIEKASKGDAQAFGEIYFALRGAIYGFSSRMLGDFMTAEDVTQEVFLFFIKNPNKFDATRGELLSFLCGVARNRILHRLRKEQLQVETLQDDLESFAESIDLSLCNPLKNLLDEELAEKVEEGIGNLPLLQREVLILREMQELSYEEIAEITETEISAVKSRLYRARRNLAKELAAYWLTNEEKNMRCVEFEKQIDLLLDDELNLLQKKEFEWHLKTCQSCQKSHQILQNTKIALKNQPHLLPTAFLNQRILQAFETHHQPQEKIAFWQKFSLPVSVFGAITLLFAFGLLGAFWLGRTTASPEVVTETVTIEKVVPTVETKVVEKVKSETLTVTKYVKVPVIKEKEVIKFVQIENPSRKIQNSPSEKGELVDYSDKTNALATKINLEQFQPISELKVRIVRKGEINE